MIRECFWFPLGLTMAMEKGWSPRKAIGNYIPDVHKLMKGFMQVKAWRI